MLNEIVGHVFAGLICFLTLTALWLMNYPDRLQVFQEQPDLAAITAVGALITFAPVIICVAIGSVRRGAQKWAALDFDDD